MLKIIKIVFLFSIIFFINSCVNKKENNLKFENRELNIVTIDSCEYLYFSNGNASWCTHKGNCKYCLKINK